MPPFATIAKIPGFDAEAIARFLMNPHPKVPDMQMQLSRPEAEDLAAYIVGQESEAAPERATREAPR